MIPSTDSNMEVEKGDFMKIFLDNGSNQLEDKFFLSKKKLLNAQKGKNELFDMLKMKLKGLDMLIALMHDNKELQKGEDLLCVETLLKLLTVAKNDKVLFPPIYKKIKSLTSLLIRNQTNVKNEANYSSLAKFVVYILNLGYESSSFQQLTDLVAVDDALMKLYSDELFKKIFKGRNVNIKAKDAKFIVRFLLTRYIRPCQIVKRLLFYLKPKDNGGARTPHQISLILSLIEYIAELIGSKANQKEFKEKEIVKIMNAFKEVIEMNDNGNVGDDQDNSTETSQNKQKKQQGFLKQLDDVYSKLITSFTKGFDESERLTTQKEEMAHLFKEVVIKNTIPLKDKDKEHN